MASNASDAQFFADNALLGEAELTSTFTIHKESS